nr:MAG TPA: Fructose-bisphosphate aldolase A [Caudoviricetes sp.]
MKEIKLYQWEDDEDEDDWDDDWEYWGEEL